MICNLIQTFRDVSSCSYFYNFNCILFMYTYLTIRTYCEIRYPQSDWVLKIKALPYFLYTLKLSQCCAGQLWTLHSYSSQSVLKIQFIATLNEMVTKLISYKILFHSRLHSNIRHKNFTLFRLSFHQFPHLYRYYIASMPLATMTSFPAE